MFQNRQEVSWLVHDGVIRPTFIAGTDIAKYEDVGSNLGLQQWIFTDSVVSLGLDDVV